MPAPAPHARVTSTLATSKSAEPQAVILNAKRVDTSPKRKRGEPTSARAARSPRLRFRLVWGPLACASGLCGVPSAVQVVGVPDQNAAALAAGCRGHAVRGERDRRDRPD